MSYHQNEAHKPSDPLIYEIRKFHNIVRLPFPTLYPPSPKSGDLVKLYYLSTSEIYCLGCRLSRSLR